MLFTSFPFIVFLLLTVVLYYILPKRFQWILLLVANAVFYAFAGVGSFIFICITIVTTYLAVMCMSYCQSDLRKWLDGAGSKAAKQERKAYKNKIKTKKRMVLCAWLFINIGILAILKYAGFLHKSAFSVDLVLPLGISFYTFQSAGYVIDVYTKKAEPEKNFFKTALFISFFPQLIQGPISRFEDLKKTLYDRHAFVWKNVLFGMERVLFGYFKKMVIADRMLIAVNTLFNNPQTYDGFFCFVGMLFYAFELYADFTGGIDITIGIAQMLGIEVTENFVRPYFSKNIAEYWRRWHITMGTWFRDYIFYPLAASTPILKLSVFLRKKFGLAVSRRVPVYIVTLVVWAATGIWHGAGWNFLVWGLLNGIIILVSQELAPLYKRFHKAFPRLVKSDFFKCFQVVRTIILMSLLRLLDCYRSVSLTAVMIGSMFTKFNIKEVLSGGLLQLGLSAADFTLLFAGLVILIAVSLRQRKESIRESLYKKNIVVQYFLVCALFLAILIFGIYGIGYDKSQFIYNQF